MVEISADVARQLREYAERYETAAFLDGDPSWFMHQVSGAANQEAMAFVASVLSYGSRKQFLPKIQQILDNSRGEVHQWVLSADYERMFRASDSSCFYRLYTHSTMNGFLAAYRQLLADYGTLGNYVRQFSPTPITHHPTPIPQHPSPNTHHPTGLSAIASICSYFSAHGVSVVVPKDTQSACKRVAMFLRWMVRSGSPVDLGLWAGFIDRRTLIMPLDTHVVSESVRLGLMHCKTASMSAARQLTQSLATVFPDDPLKGDFALFGYGVDV